jgi:hypothetical protein
MVFLALAITGCGQKKQAVVHTPLELLDAAVIPDGFTAALRKSGGAHFHSVSTFRMESGERAQPNDGSKPASPSSITTTTDLWIDKQGNIRLVESNDQDGGREIVSVGNEIAVALRYSKMIRRPSQDGEKTRLFAEATAGPWAAWEIVRRQVEVDGTVESGFRLKRGSRRREMAAGSLPATGLRKWREKVEVKAIDGLAKLDPASHALLNFSCKTTFGAVRDDVPVEGEITVTATVDEVGKTAEIAMPSADTLPVRQRTILEEKALLAGSSLSKEAKK